MRDLLRSLTGRLRGGDEIAMAGLAVLVGVAAGYGSVGFRLAIDGIQFTVYGSAADSVLSAARELDWWHRLLAPALGGLGVGLLIHFLMPERRPQGVADVIAVRAAHGGRMRLRDGLAQALASAASIGVGASVGREGPVVHLAAAVGSWLGQRCRLERTQWLTLLGCGVASGVAAAFNAPIAGVFFALEVVVGHYGLGAFAPVVIAAVAGTIVARAEFGDFPAFAVPGVEIASYTEMPAFLLLGIVCAAAATAFMIGTRACARVAARTPLPNWLKPALGGLGCGALAAGFPEVIGVGYETTELALGGAFDLPLLLVLIVVKTLATVLCLGFGFSGGVFSPSLCIGALAGAAFGIVAAAAVPEVGANPDTYGIVGMGAVAAAVLGAPISTILIVFELTGDFSVTVAVMIAGRRRIADLPPRSRRLVLHAATRRPRRRSVAGTGKSGNGRNRCTRPDDRALSRCRRTDAHKRPARTPGRRSRRWPSCRRRPRPARRHRYRSNDCAPNCSHRRPDGDRTVADLADTDVHAVEPADGLDRLLALFEIDLAAPASGRGKPRRTTPDRRGTPRGRARRVQSRAAPSARRRPRPDLTGRGAVCGGALARRYIAPVHARSARYVHGRRRRS